MFKKDIFAKELYIFERDIMLCLEGKIHHYFKFIDKFVGNIKKKEIVKKSKFYAKY